jgi:hypothetical protein
MLSDEGNEQLTLLMSGENSSEFESTASTSSSVGLNSEWMVMMIAKTSMGQCNFWIFVIY